MKEQMFKSALSYNPDIVVIQSWGQMIPNRSTGNTSPDFPEYSDDGPVRLGNSIQTKRIYLLSLQSLCQRAGINVVSLQPVLFQWLERWRKQITDHMSLYTALVACRNISG